MTFSVRKAREAQKRIAEKVVMEDSFAIESLREVCGLDVAYFDGKAVGACVCVGYGDLEVRERAYAVLDVRLPYIPTLLSFREAPAMYFAIKKLGRTPGLIMVNGQGVMHPYRCGIATHLGVVLNMPSIGVTKEKLCGHLGAELRSGVRAVVDERGEAIGAEVRAGGRRPIYISVGNKVSLQTAIDVTAKLLRSHRLPEPLRLAHEYATEVARRLGRGA